MCLKKKKEEEEEDHLWNRINLRGCPEKDDI